VCGCKCVYVAHAESLLSPRPLLSSSVSLSVSPSLPVYLLPFLPPSLSLSLSHFGGVASCMHTLCGYILKNVSDCHTRCALDWVPERCRDTLTHGNTLKLPHTDKITNRHRYTQTDTDTHKQTQIHTHAHANEQQIDADRYAHTCRYM